jgi:hypothetical protein
MEFRSEDPCVPAGTPLSPGVRGVRAGRAWLRLLLAASLVVALAAPAAAGGIDSQARDKIQSELMRTDQVLERAEQTVRDCANRKAAAYLEEAKAQQAKARELLVGPTPGAGGAQALQLTLRARDLAVKAIELCVQPAATGALRDLLDSTEELVREASAAVNASGNPEARRLLEAGLWQLDKAREAYGNKDLRRAVSLGAAARNLLQRALQRAREDRSGRDEGLVEAALDRTDLLLSDVRASDPEEAKAQAILDRAQEQQNQARASYREGKTQLAMRWTLKARSSAFEAFWLAQRVPDNAHVQAALEMIEASLRESGPGIRTSGPQEAVQMLDKAQELAGSARRLLGDGDTDRAAREARLADSLLRRALEKSGGR